MDIQELSEVNFGLCLEGRVPASMYKPEWFCTPYDKAIQVLMEPGAKKEDVAKVLSSSYISDAHDAVHKWNGIGDKENFDWPASLRQAAENLQRGKSWKR